MSESKPLAVLLSDVHFSLKNLEIASAALLQAQFKAALMKIPLVISGDLHDTKANLRGECTNKLVERFSVKDAPETIVLVGNHDLINEKSKEHSLNFLKPYATVVDVPQLGYIGDKQVLLIPYQTDPNDFLLILKDEDMQADLVICHQGLTGADMGDYIQDKSAVSVKDLVIKDGARIISGHYHNRQTTMLPNGGKWDYVGAPFTTSFGEAKDLPKGFQILYDDGSLEFVPTKLRKHVVIEIDTDFNVKNEVYLPRLNDPVWVKMSGPKDKLAQMTKDKIREKLFVEGMQFKLDLIPDKVEIAKRDNKPRTSEQLYDSMIETSNLEPSTRDRLKATWRDYANKVG